MTKPNPMTMRWMIPNPSSLATLLDVFRASIAEMNKPGQRSRCIVEGDELPPFKDLLPVSTRLTGKVVPSPLDYLLVFGRDKIPDQTCIQRAVVLHGTMPSLRCHPANGKSARACVPRTSIGPASLQKLQILTRCIAEEQINVMLYVAVGSHILANPLKPRTAIDGDSLLRSLSCPWAASKTLGNPTSSLNYDVSSKKINSHNLPLSCEKMGN